MSSITYRPEVDGLRCVAVAAVVLYHLHRTWIPGGFLGVDVFFVISGYLITSIVLRDLELGKFRFRDFWARRVRRITPALSVMVLATLASIAAIGFRGLRPEAGAQGLAALLSVANLYFFRETGDYWGPDAEVAPFLHTWSLSVEEQFYLGLPVTLWFLHRTWRKGISPILLGLALASFAAFVFLHDSHPAATFYLMPTRLWELAIGCWLPCLPLARLTAQRGSGSVAVVGLGLILGSYLLVSTLTPAAAFTAVGAALVIAFGQKGPVARVLGWRPLVYIGRISYSLYLWHWPLVVLPPQLDLPLSPAVTVALMLGAAALSYHFVEQPTRKATATVPFALAATGLIAIGAFFMARSDGSYDISAFNKIRWEGFYYDLKPNNFEDVRHAGTLAAMDCPPRQVGDDAYLTGGVIVGPDPAAPKVVLLGDSHGVMWSNVVRQVAELRDLTTSFYSMDGVPPFFHVPPPRDQEVRFVSSEVKFRFDEARIEHIRAWKPDVVVLTTRWSQVTDLAVAQDTVAFLHAHAKQVLILGQPPELAFGNRIAAEQLAYLGVDPAAQPEVALPTIPEAAQHAATVAAQLASPFDNVTYVPTAQVYLRGDRALVLERGNVVYLDDDHLTDYGADLALPVVRAAFDAAYAKINSTHS